MPSARREWDKLGATVREQFKTKLAERLAAPRVEADRLRTLPDCYKIKLRSAGYRLVYQADDTVVRIVMVAVGRRDHELIYKAAAKRV